MDIKELNKQQLILLTLLITFVVSIATGIITVSLMQQAPKSVPQTINNVIQRTIEKVTTVPAPTLPTNTTGTTKDPSPFTGDGDAVVSIYSADIVAVTPTPPATTTPPEAPKPLGQGIIISDMGLILADSSILGDKDVYKVILGKTDFDATIIKKFSNGFTILKITQKKPVEGTKTDATSQGASAGGATPKVDIKP
jgi:hypothetical protein